WLEGYSRGTGKNGLGGITHGTRAWNFEAGPSQGGLLYEKSVGGGPGNNPPAENTTHIPTSYTTPSTPPPHATQVTPSPSICDWNYPQASTSALLVAMCDGSVRNLSSGVTVSTFAALASPAGGEPVEDW